VGTGGPRPGTGCSPDSIGAGGHARHSWRRVATWSSIGYTDTNMDPRTTLMAFDRYLADRGLALEAVDVGGAALNLLGVITRQMRDCDILHPALPAEVVRSTLDDLARRLGHGP